MPYAQDTIKATVFGTILGVQTWSTSLWFGTHGFGVGETYGIDQLNGLRDSGALQGYWAAWWLGVNDFVGNRTIFNGVKYSLYNGTSHTPDAESTWINSAVPTGTHPQSLPSECAIVVSTRTNTPGPSGRGRSYLPCLSASIVSTTGGLATADAQELATSYGTLLSAINGHDFDAESGVPGDTYNLYASLASYTAGTNHALTRVECDTRIDSQRRREDKLPVTRVTADVSA